MSQILVRRLAPEAHSALKARARQENRSAEAVAREILEGSLLPAQKLGFGSRLATVWDGADLSGMSLDRDQTSYEPIDLE